MFLTDWYGGLVRFGVDQIINDSVGSESTTDWRCRNMYDYNLLHIRIYLKKKLFL